MTRSHIDLLEDSMTKTGALIAAVEPDQLHLPTPCAEFTVAQLINHLVGWADSFANRLNSVTSDADPNAYIAGPAPASEFNKSAALVVSAYRADLDGARQFPIGILLMEYVTHGWDLATAIGQICPFTDEGAKAGLAVGKAMLKPESRGPGQSFGPELPASSESNTVQQLVAFLGRNPYWAS